LKNRNRSGLFDAEFQKKPVMDDIFGLIPILIGGFVLYAITRAVVRIPGESLKRKFAKLGTLKGKHIAEIVAVAGNPNSRSGMADGRTLCQWIASGYHISLVFTENICDGVTHEFSA